MKGYEGIEGLGKDQTDLPCFVHVPLKTSNIYVKLSTINMISLLKEALSRHIYHTYGIKFKG